MCFSLVPNIYTTEIENFFFFAVASNFKILNHLMHKYFFNNSTQQNVFSTHLRRILDILTTYFGHILDIFWTYLGHVYDIFDLSQTDRWTRGSGLLSFHFFSLSFFLSFILSYFLSFILSFILSFLLLLPFSSPSFSPSFSASSSTSILIFYPSLLFFLRKYILEGNTIIYIIFQTLLGMRTSRSAILRLKRFEKNNK